MRLARPLHAATLLAILLATGAASPPPCRPAIATTLHVYFNPQGAPFVLADLDGTPATLLVDTGAQASGISGALARQAGLENKASGRSSTVLSDGRPVAAYFAKLGRLLLGTLTLHSMDVLVFPDLASASLFKADTEIEGTLGADIWRRYSLDLDFPRQRLTLYDSHGCRALPPDWRSGFAAVPITVDRHGYVLLPVTVNGQPLTALLDTGTSVSYFPAGLFARSGLLAEASAAFDGPPIATVGGLVPSRIYRLRQMTIGTETIAHPLYAAPAAAPRSLGPGASAQANAGEVLTLGDDFIRTHHIFISYAASTLYIAN